MDAIFDPQKGSNMVMDEIPCAEYSLCKEFDDNQKFLFNSTENCKIIEQNNPIVDESVAKTEQVIFTKLKDLGFDDTNISVNSYLVIPTAKKTNKEVEILQKNIPKLYKQIIGELKA